MVLIRRAKMKATQHEIRRKARARLRLARDRIARADYAAAMDVLRSTLRQLEKEPHSHVERAQCYIELARCYNQQGQHASAITHAQWALNVLRNEWDAEIALAEAHLEMGTALVRTGRYPEAQEHLTTAYRTFIGHSLWAKAARCLETIGVLARQDEQVVRAINAFNFAKQLYQQVEDTAGVQRTKSALRELIPKE